jgi:hypothetical protein
LNDEEGEMAKMITKEGEYSRIDEIKLNMIERNSNCQSIVIVIAIAIAIAISIEHFIF